MDDFEDDYKNALEAGQRNLRATKLLSNWCFHAELTRSGGRGLIEAETGLPIGHMGVQCKFAKKGSMQSWLLEDSAFDFYKNNCKNCTERLPVGIPNIIDFVGPREKAAEKRKNDREEEKRAKKQKQVERQKERTKLRYELSLEETYVFDLLDELDKYGVAMNDSRLEQLANLAPETFTRKVIQHLLPSVLHEHLPYSTPAAKALFSASLEPEEKLSVAVYLVKNYEKSSDVVDAVLSEAKNLSQCDLKIVLDRFVSMALGPPPGAPFIGGNRVQIDAAPIQLLSRQRSDDIYAYVNVLLSDENPRKVEAGVKIILATGDDELLSKHNRSIFAKLMRRRTQLPKERRDSSVIFYLRRAATKSLDCFPEVTDEIMQLYLADNDDTGREEAHRVYSSVFKHNNRENPQVRASQKIAFKRLLWAAVEHSGDSMGHASQFFRSSWEEFTQLAVENFDDLIGAAATLSEKHKKINLKSVLELPDSVLSEIEKGNKRAAIDNLQEALVGWAALGAQSKGSEGISEFLDLYRRLPKDDEQMRGKMIFNITKLLSGVESLLLVLSDWYSALMDESVIVRGKAVQAWENVPYSLAKDFPDLFFQAFSVLLNDPYNFVHKSAVRSVRYRAFPKEQRRYLKPKLWTLILHYSKTDNNDFVVDCIDALASLCTTSEELNGEIGQVLTEVLFKLEGSALYHAINRLNYRFKHVPGFTRVALKAIRDAYTRSISTDDCMSVIQGASQSELKSCVDDIKKSFDALRPFRINNFKEAILYAAVLTKAGEYEATSIYFKELVAAIPKEDRNKHWLLQASLIEVASTFENAINDGEGIAQLIKKWINLLSEMEKENEERAKLRDFPASFFFED